MRGDRFYFDGSPSREMLAFQTPYNSEGRFFGHLSVINALLMFYMRYTTLGKTE